MDVDYVKKIEQGEFSEEDVPKLLTTLSNLNSQKIMGVETNYILDKLFSAIKKNSVVLGAIAKKCNCKLEDIYVGNIDGELAEDIFYKNNGKFPYSVVVGDLSLKYLCSNENLSNLKCVFGSLDFSNSKINDVSNLEFVLGSADFSDCQIKNLSSLKEIKGHARFERATIKDVSNLEYIVGNAVFSNVRINGLDSLRKVGGNAVFSGIIKRLTNLEYVNGNVTFRSLDIHSVPKLTEIRGGLMMSDSNIEKMSSLCECGVMILNNKIKELPSMKSFKGYVVYDNKAIEKYIQENFHEGSIGKKEYIRKYSIGGKK